MDYCKELFLEDVVGFSVIPQSGTTLPLPFSVRNIIGMSNCSLADAALTVNYQDDAIRAKDGSITAKCTAKTQSAGHIYSIDIAATIEGDSTELRNAYNNIVYTDCYVVLKTNENKQYLCYSLPNTFSIALPTNIQGVFSKQLTITLKSMSEFIPIN